MTTKSFGRTSLAALASLLLMAAAPAVAQTMSQPTPTGQTSPGTPASSGYQNQNNTGSMQGSGQTYNSSGNSSGMTTKAAASGESLTRVKNAKTTLASAQVQDATGQQVGQVTTVHTSRSGHPTKVDITLSAANGGQAKTIAVSASKLRYDKTSKTLISNLTASDLEAMPAATSSSM